MTWNFPLFHGAGRAKHIGGSFRWRVSKLGVDSEVWRVVLTRTPHPAD